MSTSRNGTASNDSALGWVVAIVDIAAIAAIWFVAYSYVWIPILRGLVRADHGVRSFNHRLMLLGTDLVPPPVTDLAGITLVIVLVFTGILVFALGWITRKLWNL